MIKESLFVAEERNTRIAKAVARAEHVFASLKQVSDKGLRCIELNRAYG